MEIEPIRPVSHIRRELPRKQPDQKLPVKREDAQTETPPPEKRPGILA